MGNKISLMGEDTLKINGDIIDELANGESVVMTFPNELANIEKGKNGVSIYTKNEQGTISEMTCRVLRGGSKDRLLNNLVSSQLNDFAAFTLINTEFIKRIGDGAGNIVSDIYFSRGGIITKFPETKSNATGDAEQSVSVYTLKFAEIKIIKG